MSEYPMFSDGSIGSGTPDAAGFERHHVIPTASADSIAQIKVHGASIGGAQVRNPGRSELAPDFRTG
jgi:hypothetical protein